MINAGNQNLKPKYTPMISKVDGTFCAKFLLFLFCKIFNNKKDSYQYY